MTSMAKSFVFLVRQTPRCRSCFVLIAWNIKKKRGNPVFAYPACSGSRIALRSKISNTEAHALVDTIYIRCQRCHGRQPLLYHANELNLRDSNKPQIKRQSNVFSKCLSPVRCPIIGFGGLTVQNYIVFETVLWFLEKNLFFLSVMNQNKCFNPAESVKKKHFPQSWRPFFG